MVDRAFAARKDAHGAGESLLLRQATTRRQRSCRAVVVPSSSPAVTSGPRACGSRPATSATATRS
jgi:hypothetical protein